MRITRFILAFAAFFMILSMDIAAQPEQLVQNGSFEIVGSEPNDQNQLANNCWKWEDHGSSPDLYYIGSPAFRPGCPWPGGNSANGIGPFTSLSTFVTPPTGTHCAGIGSQESIQNILSKSTYADSWVKVKFRYSPRWYKNQSNGLPQDLTFAIYLDNTDPDLESTIIDTKSLGNLGLQECSWYTFETAWIHVDGTDTYDLLRISGITQPDGSDFWEDEYIYIDDVELLNDKSCCPEYIIYDGSYIVPHQVHVIDFIQLRENVQLVTGQYSFKAGNKIIIDPDPLFNTGTGIVEIDGSTVTLEIEDCNPITNPDITDPLVVGPLPNVFTPNGDGMNDNYCVNVQGANSYKITVFNRSGQVVHEDEGPVVGNFPCIWDGTCSSPAPACLTPGTKVEEDTHFLIVEFFGCEDQEYLGDEHVNVRISPEERLVNPNDTSSTAPMDSSNTDLIKDFTHSDIRLFPNPTTGDFNVFSSEPIIGVAIFSMEGRLVFESSEIYENSIEISAGNLGSAIYNIRIITDSGVAFRQFVIQK